MIEFFCRKTKISLSPLFFALTTLFLIADREGIAAAVLLFSLFHEAAHLAVILFLGVKIKSVKISLSGIGVDILENTQSPKRLAVFFAGFSLNYLLALLFLFLGETKYMLINAAIAVFTSFPLSFSDGGEIIRELFPEKNLKVFFSVSAFISSVVLLSILMRTENLLLLIPIVGILLTIKR